MSNTSPSLAPTSLFRIPLELRLEIYRYLLVPRAYCWVNGKIEEDEPDFRLSKAVNDIHPYNILPYDPNYNGDNNSAEDDNDTTSGSEVSSDEDDGDDDDDDDTDNDVSRGGWLESLSVDKQNNIKTVVESYSDVEEKMAKRNFWGKHTAILRTCRQIYSEAMPILYSETNLILDRYDIPNDDQDDTSERPAALLLILKDCPIRCKVGHLLYNGSTEKFGSRQYEQDIEQQNKRLLPGLRILDEHCSFESSGGVVTIVPNAGAAIKVNGIPVTEAKRLRSGSHVLLGDFYAFRFDNFTTDLVGVLEPQTFAKFQRLHFNATFNVSDWILQFYQDSTYQFRDEVDFSDFETMTDSYLLPYLVKLLSRSLMMTSLTITIGLYNVCDSFIESSAPPTVEEHPRRYDRAKKAVLDAFIRHTQWDVLKSLSNIRSFSLEFRILGDDHNQTSEVISPASHHAEMLYDLKCAIENNWTANHVLVKR